MEIKILKTLKGYDGWPVVKGTVDGHRFSARWDGNWKVFILVELTDRSKNRRMGLHDKIKQWCIQNEKELLDAEAQPYKSRDGTGY